jgi:Pentapeptide repeats (9 copies)
MQGGLRGVARAVRPAQRELRMEIDETIHVSGARRLVKAEQADLSGSTFTDVNISRATFRDVNFAGAQFEDANLSGWSVRNANMAGLHVSNADLRGASIDGSLTTGMTIDGIDVSDLLTAYRTLTAVPG